MKHSSLILVLGLASLAFGRPSSRQDPALLPVLLRSPSGEVVEFEIEGDSTLRWSGPGGGSIDLAGQASWPAQAELEDLDGVLVTGPEGSIWAALALRIGSPQGDSYHVLWSDLGAREGSLSAAIFRSRGEPFRILDVFAHGWDAHEITFRRGRVEAGPREPSLGEIEELVFSESCAAAPGFLPGKSVLVDLRTGKPTPFGSER